MHQISSNSGYESNEPGKEINQGANDSTICSGMQAIQGDYNNQVQITLQQFIQGQASDNELSTYFQDTIGLSAIGQAFSSIEQHKVYREVWRSLQSLKLDGETLWKEANVDNLIKFSRQLKITNRLIDNNSVLFEEHDYQALCSVLKKFKQFEIGKTKLINIRSAQDVKEEEIKTSKEKVERDIEQVRSNKKTKLEYEKTLNSIRISFREQLLNKFHR